MSTAATVSRTSTEIAGRVAATAVAALSVVVDTPSASAADQEFIYSGQEYGYAGATFDRAGRSSVRNIDLLVADRAAAPGPSTAYFLLQRRAAPDTTPTRP